MQVSLFMVGNYSGRFTRCSSLIFSLHLLIEYRHLLRLFMVQERYARAWEGGRLSELFVPVSLAGYTVQWIIAPIWPHLAQAAHFGISSGNATLAGCLAISGPCVSLVLLVYGVACCVGESTLIPHPLLSVPVCFSLSPFTEALQVDICSL